MLDKLLYILKPILVVYGAFSPAWPLLLVSNNEDIVKFWFGGDVAFLSRPLCHLLVFLSRF